MTGRKQVRWVRQEEAGRGRKRQEDALFCGVIRPSSWWMIAKQLGHHLGG
jgi:hypothetical protein